MVAPQRTTRREAWKPVVGHEGIYAVSDRGRVYSVERRDCRGQRRGGHHMRIYQQKRGHKHRQVCLSKNGICAQHTVHHLVLFAFRGRPPGRLGTTTGSWQTNHKNGRPFDNRLKNLEWVTSEQNLDHATANNLRPRGIAHGRAKLSERNVAEIRACAGRRGDFKKIADRLGVSKGLVSQVRNRRIWKHVR